MEFENKPYSVYVKTDDVGRITAINSDAFLDNTDGWRLIDSGYGDKYHHAQGNYLPLPIVNEQGILRYKLIDGKAVERTIENIEADHIKSEYLPSQFDIIEAQITYTAMMTNTLLEV